MVTSEILQHFYSIPTLKLPAEISSYDSFILTENEKIIDFPEIKLPNTILGKQAEFLFESLLKCALNYNILLSNIQVQGATETLGELDYLIQNTKTKELIHIEFTCKFYLLDSNHSEINEAQWIGPNRKDTLHDKLVKFQKKQFPLLYLKETRKHLDPIGVQSNHIIQKQCIKASLFIPMHVSATSLSEAYQECIVGYWVSIKELKLDAKKEYAIIQKRSWLLPVSEIKEWKTSIEITTKISESIEQKMSPLIYEKHGNTVKKIFVVWW